MRSTRTSNTPTRISGAVTLAIISLGLTSGSSAAFPILLTRGAGQKDMAVQEIDNRTYRHCHNKARFTECYTRKPGQKDIPDAGQAAKHERNVPADGSRQRHLHTHHGAMIRNNHGKAGTLVAGPLFFAMSRTNFTDVVADCRSGNPARVMRGCSIVIDSGAYPLMDLATAYTYRAGASEADGKHGDALADLNRAIDLNPNLPGLYSNRGNVYLALGDEDKALADYTEAIRRDLNFAGAYFNRGNVYSRKGDLDSALRDLTAAVLLNPTWPSAYYNRGIVYFQMGRLSEATSDFRKALSLNPQHDGALQALRRIENTISAK